MSVKTSQAGQDSVLFRGMVGTTYPSRKFHHDNLSLGQKGSDSDGMWAFCRFDHEEILAARVGFQRGGFNITDRDIPLDPSTLQLHLEIITADGGFIWLPTGVFHSEDVSISADLPGISLKTGNVCIFSITGWPDMIWHFQSADRSLETKLELSIPEATIVPDCILPYCIFAMWIAVGEISGWVRIEDEITEVQGRGFLDHPRIRHLLSPENVRKRYLYTTLSFEDGSAFYCYYAEDGSGKPISYYSFATLMTSDNEYHFSTGTELLNIEFDENGLPNLWELRWTDGSRSVHANISTREHKIAKIWGSPYVPKNFKEFLYYPLVLDGSAIIDDRGERKEMSGTGLAEYFDIDA